MILLTLSRGKGEETVRLQLPASPAEYGRYMIQDSGHYEYDPNLEEFYDYERYGKLRMEKETGAFTEKGYVAYCGTLTLGELMAGGPAEQHQREQEFQMGGM